MSRNHARDAGATGTNGEHPASSDQAGELLSEVLLDHIDKLLKEEPAQKASSPPTAAENEEHHPTFRHALTELLADPNIRAVLALHFGTWLKDDPVKRWLWECAQALEDPHILEDASYLHELEQLLAQVTSMAGEAFDDPQLMRALLRRLLTTPWQFTAPEG